MCTKWFLRPLAQASTYKELESKKGIKSNLELTNPKTRKINKRLKEKQKRW
jgi:hypothetical protein